MTNGLPHLISAKSDGRGRFDMATDRLRGRPLQRFRDNYLRAHPLCAECERNGRLAAATQLDHKVALVNGGKDFHEDPDQAQGLCVPCHRDKTARDLGHRIKPVIGTDGWPVKD